MGHSMKPKRALNRSKGLQQAVLVPFYGRGLGTYIYVDERVNSELNSPVGPSILGVVA